MEEHKDIQLQVGNCSWDKKLGAYYIDFSESIKNYEQNVWDGAFDAEGLPYILNNGKQYYSVVNLAQYGLLLISKSKIDLPLLNRIANKIIDAGTSNGNTFLFVHDYFESKYEISPPWCSAMTQGEVASLLYRLYQLTGEERYLEIANMSIEALSIPVEQGGVLTYLDEKYVWLEEYPSNPASYVLNGFIYAVFGLMDAQRIAPNENREKLLRKCLETLEYSISKFDCGYWSYYDLEKKELVRYYYQKNVHVIQLQALYLMTKNSIFNTYAQKWSKTLNPVNYLFVQFMYRFLPRWRMKKIRL